MKDKMEDLSISDFRLQISDIKDKTREWDDLSIADCRFQIAD
jgi:hypothetical protein